MALSIKSGTAQWRVGELHTPGFVLVCFTLFHFVSVCFTLFFWCDCHLFLRLERVPVVRVRRQ